MGFFIFRSVENISHSFQIMSCLEAISIKPVILRFISLSGIWFIGICFAKNVECIIMHKSCEIVYHMINIFRGCFTGQSLNDVMLIRESIFEICYFISSPYYLACNIWGVCFLLHVRVITLFCVQFKQNWRMIGILIKILYFDICQCCKIT